MPNFSDKFRPTPIAEPPFTAAAGPNLTEGIDTSGYAMPVVRVGGAPRAQPKTNEDYFKKYHEGVVSSGKALQENGTTTTMRIASVGIDGKTYLIPTYDPETKTVLPIDQAVKKAIPSIKSGELQPYDNPDAAEADRAAFEPRIVGGPIVPAQSAAKRLPASVGGLESGPVQPGDAVQTPLPEDGRLNFSDRFRRMPPEIQRQIQKGQAAARRVEEGLAPPPGMTRIRGTGVDIPSDAAAVARFGIEAVGSLVGPGEIPAGLRGLRRAYQVGKGALKTGAAAGLADAAARSVFPEEHNPMSEPGMSPLEVGTFSALTDAVFGGIGGSILRRLKQSGNVEPGAREALAQIRARGGNITAGRLTKNPGVDVAETMAEGALFGRAGVQEDLLKAQAIAQKDIDDIVATLMKGKTREEASRLLQSSVKDGADLFRQIGVRGYDELDQAVKHDAVEIGFLLNWRKSLTTRGSAAPSGIQAVMRVIDGQLENATGMPARQIYASMDAGVAPPRVSFGAAARMRSELIKLEGIPDFIASGGDEIGKRAVQLADDEIERAGEALGLTDAEHYRQFRRVNEFWKNGRDRMRMYTMESLIKASPDAALQMVLRPGGTDRLRVYRQAVFGALGESADVTTAEEVIRINKSRLSDRRISPEMKALYQARIDQATRARDTWEGLQGAFLMDALNKADKEAGVSSKGLFGESSRPAPKIKNTLREYSDATLNELFPSGMSRHSFERAVRTLEIIQSPAGKSVPGRIFVQLNQAAAVGQVAGAVLSLTFLDQKEGALGAAAILVGPKALGALVRNPRFVDLMVRSARGGRTEIAQRMRAYSQLAQVALREGARVYDSHGYEVLAEGEEK